MVYDVTEYLQDHPGGSEVMLEQAGELILVTFLILSGLVGKDAEEMFRDIGHSNAALAMLKKFEIGKLDEPEIAPGEERSDQSNCCVS